MNESLIDEYAPHIGLLRTNMTPDERTKRALNYPPKLMGMALKLYVHMVYPDVSDNLFHMDADVFWIRDWDPWVRTQMESHAHRLLYATLHP